LIVTIRIGHQTFNPRTAATGVPTLLFFAMPHVGLFAALWGWALIGWAAYGIWKLATHKHAAPEASLPTQPSQAPTQPSSELTWL
jgi:endonuclease/exonuclease/phosphatase (EEP) superfamily protein YafD